MKWIYDLQFIAAVGMPQDLVDRYGTTVNGMWADPDRISDQQLAGMHAAGKKVLFSVPMIALTPFFYRPDKDPHIIQEACKDVFGETSLVPWYYWEPEPVYSICFYSEVFQDYLLEKCKRSIERGFDVVNLDEIQTNLGLMKREPRSSGFCSLCLGRFKDHVRKSADLDASLADLDDDALRKQLRENDVLFDQYQKFHEAEAFKVVSDFIDRLRKMADAINPEFAICANVGYLGNLVPVNGDLWGAFWGEMLDFVLMENDYKPIDDTHLVLPRGKFTPWYKLGSSFKSHAPVWMCPSINVPKQFNGEKRTTYYNLMFLEAYANDGRWGYYWWPGVDVETRVKTTAPAEMIDYTQFLIENREYCEHLRTENKVAILYMNSSMRPNPDAHFQFVALSQALSELGYQHDVLYSGDGVFGPDDLDPDLLAKYQAIVLPEAADLTEKQKQVLNAYAAKPGRELIQFVDQNRGLSIRVGTICDAAVLSRYWMEYKASDREKIGACIPAATDRPIVTSKPAVNGVRYVNGNQTILHLINYQYDEATDTVEPVKDLEVRLPWDKAGTPTGKWISLETKSDLQVARGDNELIFTIPAINLHGIVVLTQ